MGAAHPRDDAEAARMIAALRDLDVGEMPRRQPKARRGEVGDVAGAPMHPDHRPGRRAEADAASRPARRFAIVLTDFAAGAARPGAEEFPAASGQRLPDDFRRLRHLVNAHESVHLRQQFGQVVAKPLRQAAGDDQSLGGIGSGARLGGFQNGLHAFLLGRVNERTSVDNDGHPPAPPGW